MTVGLDGFHYLVDIFDNSEGQWEIFNIKFTGTELTKTKSRMIDCYSNRTT